MLAGCLEHPSCKLSISHGTDEFLVAPQSTSQLIHEILSKKGYELIEEDDSSLVFSFIPNPILKSRAVEAFDPSARTYSSACTIRASLTDQASGKLYLERTKSFDGNDFIEQASWYDREANIARAFRVCGFQNPKVINLFVQAAEAMPACKISR